MSFAFPAEFENRVLPVSANERQMLVKDLGFPGLIGLPGLGFYLIFFRPYGCNGCLLSFTWGLLARVNLLPLGKSAGSMIYIRLWRCPIR
jgi:hypothetical protein